MTTCAVQAVQNILIYIPITIGYRKRTVEKQQCLITRESMSFLVNLTKLVFIHMSYNQDIDEQE